jgi:hypothetical protein
LPAEIRNLIYAYVLSKGTHHVGTAEMKKKFMERTDQRFSCGEKHQIVADLDHKDSNHALSLLGVCRQTFSETALLPFLLNDFCIESLVFLRCHLVQLLTRDQCAAITSIRLRLPSEHFCLADESMPALSYYLPNIQSVVVEAVAVDVRIRPFGSTADIRAMVKENREWLIDWANRYKHTTVDITFADFDVM